MMWEAGIAWKASRSQPWTSLIWHSCDQYYTVKGIHRGWMYNTKSSISTIRETPLNHTIQTKTTIKSNTFEVISQKPPVSSFLLPNEPPRPLRCPSAGPRAPRGVWRRSSSREDWKQQRPPTTCSSWLLRMKKHIIGVLEKEKRGEKAWLVGEGCRSLGC